MLVETEQEELTLDGLLGEILGHSEMTDHPETCSTLFPECGRQAVYRAFWGPDTRMPGGVQCLCYRKTLVCLPCFDENAKIAVTPHQAVECSKCERFMVMVRTVPVRNAAGSW